MTGDPYQTLGVDRGATATDLHRAYRRLAKTLHPDLNPSDTEAEAKFKQLSAAYGILSDPLSRARYDRGEIDAAGDERPQDDAIYAADSDAYDGASDFVDHDDVLSEIFSRGEAGAFSTRGQDAFYHFEVAFLDAINGAVRRLTLPTGAMLDVTIPPGMREGQILRLRGKGQMGSGGGPPGDALIEIEPLAHPVFSRKGDDIYLDFPVSLPEAVLGADVDVPTPTGPVTIALPRGANTDMVLRLPGKGVPRPDGTRGDEFLTLKVMLPGAPDAELETFLAHWAPRAYDPREDFERDLSESAAQRP